MKNFDELGLNPLLKRSLESMKYETPTPIQAQAIPFALEGRDILGSAQTGTGKTAAFAIPAIEHLLNNEMSSAIVLTPTRELAKQVMDVMKLMIGPKQPIKTAFLIGGEAMGRQYAQLQRRPRLVVGTPGRINDHIKRKNLDLDKTDFLILDETDRMLDMGFSVQIDEIIKHLAPKRQTLMFSATLPDKIIKMSKNYLTNPQRIAVGSMIDPAKNIKQSIIRVKDADKYETLLNELNERNGSVVLFVKTKRSADKMAKRLSDADFMAEPIHGDLNQRRRDRVIREFRGQRFRILVATDVAARGLDIPHIQHVINYDMPQVAEDYIHRIGRTARAGADGEALCLVSPKDADMWYEIEVMMDPSKKRDRPSQSKGQGQRKKPLGRNRSKNNPNGENKPRRKVPAGREQPQSEGKKRTYGGGNKGKPANKSSHGGKPSGKSHGKNKFSGNGGGGYNKSRRSAA